MKALENVMFLREEGRGKDPTERTGLAVLGRAAEGTCWWGN